MISCAESNLGSGGDSDKGEGILVVDIARLTPSPTIYLEEV